jgi:hypothetical protein
MFFFLIFIGQNEAYGKTGLIEWSDQAAVLMLNPSQRYSSAMLVHQNCCDLRNFLRYFVPADKASSLKN